MPLNGTQIILGLLLQLAGGNPPTDVAGAAKFSKIGAALAEWIPGNVQALPGSVEKSGANMIGEGAFFVTGDPADLGLLIATNLLEPQPVDAQTLAKWTRFATALCDHMTNFGAWDPTGMTPGSPLGGQGSMSFSSVVFAPPIGTVLDVTDPVASALTTAFGVQILQHLQDNAAIVATALVGSPLSATVDGPASGTGTIF